MIISSEKVVSETVGLGQVTKAKVNANARIFNFFSTMVYSNPYIAIIRELTANMVDAMKEAGRGDQKAVITLPTDFTPYMVFRDYGTGMIHEFMMDGFMTYTESTKTENENAIGGFGIGSKAPLSYTAQFTIKCFIDGVVNVYSVFKDEDDCPCIAHLTSGETTEPNGVEIMFPVEGSDVTNFRDAAYQCLTYFNPIPELKNAAQQVEAPTYSVRTPSWGFKTGATDSRVVMGGVAYPIGKGQVREIDEFLDYGIDFYVPIGACSISLSREALQYDDKTVRILKTLVDAIRPDIQKSVSEMFENCKTVWEAEALYSEFTSGSGNPHRQRMIRGNATYRGKPLTGRVRPIDAYTGKVQIAQITSSRYQKSNYMYWTEGVMNPTMRSWLNDLTPRDIGMVLIDDAPNRPVLRMRRYLQENDIAKKGVLIIRTLNGIKFSKTDWARLLVKLGRPTFTWLSDIEPASTVRAPSQARVKRILAYHDPKRHIRPRSASSPKVTALPATGGYYVKMNSFQIEAGQISEYELLASGLKPEQVFYFNKQDFIDAGIEDDPKWKPARDAYEAKMKTYKQNHRNMALASAFKDMLQTRSRYNASSIEKAGYVVDVLKMNGIKVPTRGPIYQLNKMYNLIEDQLGVEDTNMRALIEHKYDKEAAALHAVLIKIEEDYPELVTVISSDRYVRTNYVNVYNKLIG